MMTVLSKVVLQAAVVVCLLVGVTVAGEATAFPSGTYSTKLGEDKWSIRFDKKGNYTVLLKGEAVVEGKYKVKNDTISFGNEKGKLADEDRKNVGTYRWKLKGKAITFTKVKDTNDGREKALTSGPWTKE
jgi:hypothetical protein